MSYVPEPGLDAELARSREQELEAKAAHYSELHPDEEPKPSLMARLKKLFTRS